MSATTIKAFDTTLQLTYAWLHELAEQMGRKTDIAPTTRCGQCCMPSAIG